MPDAEYWRRYRAEHPEYRARELAASRARKTKRTAEQRRAERERARARQAKAEATRDRAEYMRRYRAEHPEFRAEQSRKALARIDPEMNARRAREHRARARVASLTYRAHAIARQFVKPDPGDVIFDPLYEDAVAEAVIALLRKQGGGQTRADIERMAVEHVKAFVSRERSWQRITAPLLDVRIAAT